MLAGTVALALMGSGVALAQQRPEGRPPQPGPPAAQVSPTPQGSPQQGAPPQSPSAQQQGNAQAAAEGRIAELRARLSLTPDQEKNWPAFEQAYLDFARLRSEHWRDLRAERRSDNPVENFQAWADFASRRVNGMKRLADAAAPLYQSLDQNQQRRFLDQIYAWHPRLARLSDRISARGRDGDDEGGRGPGCWRGCDFHRGLGMGRDGDWQDRGYGRGPGSGMGPHWGWRDGDRDGRGYEDGPRSGMGPRCGWHGRHGDWGDRGYEQHGPGHGGMGPRRGWHDRDDDDGWRGGWNDRQDWRDRGGWGGGSEEERF